MSVFQLMYQMLTTNNDGYLNYNYVVTIRFHGWLDVLPSQNLFQILRANHFALLLDLRFRVCQVFSNSL